MVTGDLTNEEHKRLAEWADELYKDRARGHLPRCPFCFLLDAIRQPDESLQSVWEETPIMQFRHGNIHTDPKAWGQNRKCHQCYFLIGFGVPLEGKEFEKTETLMDGRHYNGKPKEDVQSGEVGEQLEALGYLEM